MGGWQATAAKNGVWFEFAIYPYIYIYTYVHILQISTYVYPSSGYHKSHKRNRRTTGAILLKMVTRSFTRWGRAPFVSASPALKLHFSL